MSNYFSFSESTAVLETIGEARSVLRAEVKERGFNHITDARIDRWLNQAVRRIAARGAVEAWPFLQDTIALGSTAPRELISVVRVEDGKGKLIPFVDAADARKSGIELDGTQVASGKIPQFWYLDVRLSQVRLHPVTSDTAYTCTFVKRPLKMTSDAYLSGIPDEYSDVIIDLACIEGEKDRHEFEAAAALSEYVAQRMVEMSEELDRQTSEPRGVVVTQDWA